MIFHIKEDGARLNGSVALVQAAIPGGPHIPLPPQFQIGLAWDFKKKDKPIDLDASIIGLDSNEQLVRRGVGAAGLTVSRQPVVAASGGSQLTVSWTISSWTLSGGSSADVSCRLIVVRCLAAS